MEQFKYILENQSLWAQMYKDQQKAAHLERIKENRKKDWYGNTKSYKREWDKLNRRKAIKQQSNVPTF